MIKDGLRPFNANSCLTANRVKRSGPNLTFKLFVKIQFFRSRRKKEGGGEEGENERRKERKKQFPISAWDSRNCHESSSRTYIFQKVSLRNTLRCETTRDRPKKLFFCFSLSLSLSFSLKTFSRFLFYRTRHALLHSSEHSRNEKRNCNDYGARLVE